MNQREKVLLARVHRCVDRAAGLGPMNPADIENVVLAHRRQKEAGRYTALALSCLGYGDLEDCAEYLDCAEQVLKIEEVRGA